MRATEYLFLVLLIALFSIGLTLYGNDLNKIYPDQQMNIDNISQYNDFADVADQANKTFQNFQTLGDDSKWYQKIGAGIVAIPYAVISFPIMVASAITTLTKFMGISLSSFLPAPIIYLLIVLMIVEIVRRFMEFFQRSRA